MFNGVDFAAPTNRAKLDALRERFADLCQTHCARHDIAQDPYLSPPWPAGYEAGREGFKRRRNPRSEALLQRYLIAADLDVEAAVRRLDDTIAWRRDWRCLDFYLPGAAAQYISHNPGAEVYIADSLQTDMDGDPFLIGRVSLMNADNMHPWHHLRGMTFVLERFVTRAGGTGAASYILDVSPLNQTEAAGSSSASQGAAQASAQRKSAAQERLEAWTPELLALYGPQEPGLSLIRTALNIVNAHYPELLKRVVFINANLVFLAAFKIFSLWVAPRTRDKFVFLNAGWGTRPLSHLQTWFPAKSLPPEWGGTGPRLGGREFVHRCAAAYDTEAAGQSLMQKTQ